MTLTLIWAATKNGVIGNNGTIPWHLPEDLKFFRKATAGATVIMGRKTWDSLPAVVRPLPGRENIVVTRNSGWGEEGARRAGNLGEALVVAERSGRPVFVIGGGQLYREALPLADSVIVTLVDVEVEGDTYAPELGEWGTLSASRDLRGAGGLGYTVQQWTAGVLAADQAA